jgi:hypothetical protein
METLYAYLAAAIDIDGYVLIVRRKRYARRQDGVATPHYIPTVGISNTTATIPDLFQATFPARRREFQPKNPKHRGWYWWEAEFQKARAPLLCLLPHLRIKRRQAELTLSFLNLMSPSNPGHVLNRLDAEQLRAREDLYEQVTQLNGPRPRLKYRAKATLESAAG